MTQDLQRAAEPADDDRGLLRLALLVKYMCIHIYIYREREKEM